MRFMTHMDGFMHLGLQHGCGHVSSKCRMAMHGLFCWKCTYCDVYMSLLKSCRFGLQLVLEPCTVFRSLPDPARFSGRYSERIRFPPRRGFFWLTSTERRQAEQSRVMTGEQRGQTILSLFMLIRCTGCMGMIGVRSDFYAACPLYPRHSVSRTFMTSKGEQVINLSLL